MNSAIIAAAAILAVPPAATPTHDAAGLVVAAQSDRMVWNGVVVVGGRVIVSGPRWAGGDAPAVAIVNGARLMAYPNEAWNGWRAGGNAAASFVNVNAIHLDRDGKLWIVDTGSPTFGGDPLPGGPKAIRIDPRTDRVERVYALDSAVRPGSYVDDIRVNGGHAYLTDAGKSPGIIVLDLETGSSRRVLEDSPAVRATPGRPIVVNGETLRGPDGTPVVVNADPLELSADGRYFYFGPLTGPWKRIETRLLDDPSLPADALVSGLEDWADIPPIGGAIMDRLGNLYFTELATNALKRRAPDGVVTTLLTDPRLHWVDAPFLDGRGNIWLPVPQLDLAPPFQGGTSRRVLPITLFRYSLPATARN